MIFGRDLVTCDDFGDYDDEITVVGVDFISRRPIYSLYLEGDGCFWEPLRGQRLWVIDLIVDGGRDEFMISR